MLKQIIADNNLSMSQLANATNLNYALVLKNAKKPIVGQPYNPDEINIAALTAMFEKNEIDLTTIDFTKCIKIDKTKTIKNVEFEIGQRFYSRYHKSNFTIVYKTNEYVCILEDFKTQPKVLMFSTLIACGLKDPIEIEPLPQPEIAIEKTAKTK